MTEHSLSDNIANVLERVRLAAEKSQRNAADIQLLAVSKTRPAQDIRHAHSLGLNHFGENYLQEALEKIAALQDLPLHWHFIGPVQSNKTRAIAEHFDWVHSIDRAKIARRLNDQRTPEQAPLQVCLQVNISGEASKSGVAPDQLAALADEVAALPRLQLRGLMALPAASDKADQQRQAFAALRRCAQRLIDGGHQLDTLSMGMSADLEPAIAEGATIVRIGTDIFGPRNR